MDNNIVEEKRGRGRPRKNTVALIGGESGRPTHFESMPEGELLVGKSANDVQELLGEKGRVDAHETTSVGRPLAGTDASSSAAEVKRGRGRPRKYPIMEKERGLLGEVRPILRKVDGGYLMKHLLAYFTKLLVLHHELSKEGGKFEVIFKRLKNLDFQMAEICKTVLVKEYAQVPIEEKAKCE